MNIALLLLGGVAIAVGVLMGAAGVGGILLIPFLTTLGGLSIHEASATLLFSFFFTGVVGTWLFQRRGTIDWKVATPVCGGATVFSYVGAKASSMLEGSVLTLVIGAITVLAGVYLFRPSAHAGGHHRNGSERLLLVCVGAVSGFGSGLSGAGGALFSVPMMLVLGFVPLSTVSASQVLQIVAAVFGTFGNLTFGSVDFATSGWIAVCMIAGVVLGVRIAHIVGAKILRIIVAVLCVMLGLFMLVR